MGGDIGIPAIDTAVRHGNVVLTTVGQRVVVGGGGEGQHSGCGHGARGTVLLVAGSLAKVRRRGYGDAPRLAQAAKLVLEGLVAVAHMLEFVLEGFIVAIQVLRRAVAILAQLLELTILAQLLELAILAQLLELALQALTGLLSAGAEDALGFAVVGALAGALGRREGRDAAGA